MSHTYNASGTFTVKVSVNDGTASSVGSATVAVMTASDVIRQATAAVDALAAAGTVSASAAHSLDAKLNGAIKNIAAGDIAAALAKLQSAIDQLDALVRSGRLSVQDAAPIRTLTRTIQSLSR